MPRSDIPRTSQIEKEDLLNVNSIAFKRLTNDIRNGEEETLIFRRQIELRDQKILEEEQREKNVWYETQRAKAKAEEEHRVQQIAAQALADARTHAAALRALEEENAGILKKEKNSLEIFINDGMKEIDKLQKDIDGYKSKLAAIKTQEDQITENWKTQNNADKQQYLANLKTKGRGFVGPNGEKIPLDDPRTQTILNAVFTPLSPVKMVDVIMKSYDVHAAQGAVQSQSTTFFPKPLPPGAPVPPPPPDAVQAKTTRPEIREAPDAVHMSHTSELLRIFALLKANKGEGDIITKVYRDNKENVEDLIKLNNDETKAVKKKDFETLLNNHSNKISYTVLMERDEEKLKIREDGVNAAKERYKNLNNGVAYTPRPYRTPQP